LIRKAIESRNSRQTASLGRFFAAEAGYCLSIAAIAVAAVIAAHQDDEQQPH
jgi:hypothetical protein